MAKDHVAGEQNEEAPYNTLLTFKFLPHSSYPYHLRCVDNFNYCDKFYKGTEVTTGCTETP